MRWINNLLLPLRRTISARLALLSVPGKCRLYHSRAVHVPPGAVIWLPVRSLLASASVPSRLIPFRYRIPARSIYIQIWTADRRVDTLWEWLAIWHHGAGIRLHWRRNELHVSLGRGYMRKELRKR